MVCDARRRLAGLTLLASRTATSPQSLQCAGAHTVSATTPAVASSPTQLARLPVVASRRRSLRPGTGNLDQTQRPPIRASPPAPSNVVEAVNSALFIYTRTGTQSVSRCRSTSSCQHVGGMGGQVSACRLRPGLGPFHPDGVAVQHCSQRVLERSGSDRGRRPGADPTTAWTSPGLSTIEAIFGGSDNRSPSISRLGMTSTVVDLSWDYTDCLGSCRSPARQTIVQRADLVCGNARGEQRSRVHRGGPTGVQPAMALGLPAVEYQIVNDTNCSATAADTFAVFAISGTPEAKNVLTRMCRHRIGDQREQRSTCRSTGRDERHAAGQRRSIPRVRCGRATRSGRGQHRVYAKW